MARRRRLTPAQDDFLAPAAGLETKALPGGLETKAWSGSSLSAPLPRPLAQSSPPPIAQVTGDVSATAALREVAGAMEAARREGRLVQRLPLAAIDAAHLVRDRAYTDEAEMAVLMDSLRSHGQRQAIEVTELAPGRYGLISGFRRVTALARLHVLTNDPRFATVLALLRRPDSAAAAYVAMVEENEIRLDLSFYERARIVAKSVEAGVFDTDKAALQTLFASASRAKRSKIGSFLGVYRALDGVLWYPTALSERLGLALAKALEEDAQAADRLKAALTAEPAPDAATELARLAAFLDVPAQEAPAALPPPNVSRAKHLPADLPPVQPTTDVAAAPPPGAEELRPGVFLTVTGGWTRPILTLTGPAVGPEFRERLLHWITHGG